MTLLEDIVVAKAFKNDDKSISQFMTLSESPCARMTIYAFCSTCTQPVAESIISRHDSDLIPMFIVVTNYLLLPTAH